MVLNMEHMGLCLEGGALSKPPRALKGELFDFSTPHHVRLCPHLLRNHLGGVSKRSVTVGGGRGRTGRVSGDGDGVAERGSTPSG